jgi:hypothetical protein
MSRNAAFCKHKTLLNQVVMADIALIGGRPLDPPQREGSCPGQDIHRAGRVGVL